MLSADNNKPKLKAIKKVNIGAQVYEQMKNQIISGVWEAGNKIPSKNQLMEIFGVSRTTVRQAIQKLVAIGYLEIRRGEGSYVCRLGMESYLWGMIPVSCLGEEDLKEIFTFRSLFECGVAEMAARYADDQQIEQLRENYNKMKKYVGQLDKYVEIDLQFHGLLGECTHNAFVCEIYKIIEEILRLTMGKITDSIGYEHGIKSHSLLLEAISKHDPERAREVMRFHVEKNTELYYSDNFWKPINNHQITAEG